jgi:hypothetical protein
MLGYTADDVKAYADQARSYGLSEEVLTKKASSLPYSDFTFLSYSTRDSDQLPGTIQFLASHGAVVYVDKGDARLPQPPSVATAQILKNEILKSRGIVVLVSENSKGSSWVPWELGLADVLKHREGVALLPLSNSRAEPVWASQEYLGLYPRIGYEQGQQIWVVYDESARTSMPLTAWLKKRF